MKKLIATLVAATLFTVLTAVLALAADGSRLYNSKCAGCHGPDGSISTGGSPVIKGQKSEETVRMLKGYKDGSFGGAQKDIMVGIAGKLSDDDMKALGDHIQGFK